MDITSTPTASESQVLLDRADRLSRSAFARSRRRWTLYIASWFATYAAAIAVVIWGHGSVLLAGIASSLILLVAFTCAATLSFKDVRDAVEITDSALSKQVSSLEAAGYLTVGKTFAGKMPRTSLTLTREGRAAWRGHLATLREIAGEADR